MAVVRPSSKMFATWHLFHRTVSFANRRSPPASSWCPAQSAIYFGPDGEKNHPIFPYSLRGRRGLSFSGQSENVNQFCELLHACGQKQQSPFPQPRDPQPAFDVRLPMRSTGLYPLSTQPERQPYPVYTLSGLAWRQAIETRVLERFSHHLCR